MDVSIDKELTISNPNNDKDTAPNSNNDQDDERLDLFYDPKKGQLSSFEAGLGSDCFLPNEKFPQLYEVLLYKKKDIIAIQKKLGINNNINQIAVSESKIAKKLTNSYELLLELVRDLILIQGQLNIDINSILEAELRRNKASSDKPIRLFDLLLSLEDDIVEFHGPLEDDPDVILPKYDEMKVKKIWFTGKRLLLFPNLTP
ncbi:7659_t:CDS:2 [Ambispora leptoticha]|uniref:7659_t:CDS:1 n=1 Tax=Ambispora leptoticha TaxID=144679 RepID=A0A9N8V7J7_9GLOM|nr:7659_t:CDS:2 [Ambispora leptoticha]